MSDYFKIASSAGEYAVRIGASESDSDSGAADGAARPIVLCDRFFAADYEARGYQVIAIEASENAKSFERMGDIFIALRDLGANRRTRLLAVGGGVIQDIATFVASLYMRGLAWDYLPTTLLGMVDSCIGGKSSINVGNYKNLVGNFYPPRNIDIDMRFVATLNVEQRVAGLCEAVKICFAHPGGAFDDYLRLNPSAASGAAELQDVIRLSLLTKRWFIEIDEHDRKERLLLNYGHTFGHAIESACDFAIPHGIAVGIGVLASLEFALANGHYATSPARVTALRTYMLDLLAALPRLPEQIAQVHVDQLLARFEADKKHSSTHYAVIVPDAQGQLVRLEIEKTDTHRALLLQAFEGALALAAAARAGA
jgi:3-dehydroquinate synthase